MIILQQSARARNISNSALFSLPQWNGGGGRDSDVDLMALTRWWFDRRDQCRAVTTTSASTASSDGGRRQGTSPVKDSAQTNAALESFWAQGCLSVLFI